MILLTLSRFPLPSLLPHFSLAIAYACLTLLPTRMPPCVEQSRRQGHAFLTFLDGFACTPQEDSKAFDLLINTREQDSAILPADLTLFSAVSPLHVFFGCPSFQHSQQSRQYPAPPHTASPNILFLCLIGPL